VAAGTTSGTDIDWYACNASPAQDWTHESNGELVNPNSGLCLTDPGGNPSGQLELETCTDAATQVWNLPSGTTTGNTITVSNPGNQTSTVGTAASLQVAATDSASGQTRRAQQRRLRGPQHRRQLAPPHLRQRGLPGHRRRRLATFRLFRRA
jgi:Ricin-type beta-trefoil lectin domain